LIADDSSFPDVGGSNLTARPGADAFGIAQQPKMSVEGINISTELRRGQWTFLRSER
jgi:hypothetical protein